MLIRIRIVLAEPRDHPAGTSLPTAPSVSTIHPHPRLTHPHPQLNVSVPEHLARLAQTHKATLVYISTDYVFDGTSPPYPPSARTHPLNLYGRTKRDGELAVLGVVGEHHDGVDHAARPRIAERLQIRGHLLQGAVIVVLVDSDQRVARVGVDYC